MQCESGIIILSSLMSSLFVLRVTYHHSPGADSIIVERINSQFLGIRIGPVLKDFPFHPASASGRPSGRCMKGFFLVHIDKREGRRGSESCPEGIAMFQCQVYSSSDKALTPLIIFVRMCNFNRIIVQFCLG